MDKVIKIMVALIVVMLALLIIPKMMDKEDDEENIDGIELIPMQMEKPESSNFPNQEIDYWVNDSIYIWDDEEVNWVITGEVVNRKDPDNLYVQKQELSNKPIKIKWETLMDIRYRLKYLAQMNSKVFSPVFGENLKKWHGKEVIIEGFVIPYDEEGKLLALSYNPYASCFFCGNASPASVISMYMKNSNTLYDLDDFRKFKGIFYLNQDDPDQFYYILKDVVDI
ncbi:hypothetical protein [Crocinitomix catalasitica]|uniref:hypothetical protein n=1 Tax=Crocinitomix catalasitica TaxID=184607 RepID=UPI000684C263|nr:hypothetical protein [Crocinitomix catalasitica]